MREPTEHRDSGWSEKHVADVSRLILNFKSFSLIVETTDSIEVSAIFCQSNMSKNVQLKNVQPNLQHVAVLRTKQPRGLWGPTKKKRIPSIFAGAKAVTQGEKKIRRALVES